MTFNYAAGMKSIQKALAASIVSEMVDAIAEGKDTAKYTPLLKVLQSRVGKDVNIVKALRDVPPERIKASIYRAKKSQEVYLDEKSNLQEVLEQVIIDTYGEQVNTILTKEFEEFIKAGKIVNKAFSVMFAEFQRNFIQATEGKRLTETQKLEIIKGLIDKFPIMRGPLDNAFENGIAIFDVGSSESGVSDVVRPFITDANGNKRKVTVAAILKGMKAAISAGAVIPIHFIDAAPINEMAREGRQALFIHDAKMENILDSDSGVMDYNKKWYEANRDYSLVESLYEAYSRVMKGAKLNEKDSEEVSELSEDLKDLANRVAKGRKELFDSVKQVGQMVGMEGSVYTVDGAVEQSLTEEITEYNGKTKKEVKEWVERIKENPFLSNFLEDIDLKDC
jgi:hypothetical protein